MHFATTLTLLNALILSGSNVLALPVPAKDATSIDLSSLSTRELSYESTRVARAFDFDDLTLEDRGLRSGLWELKNNIFAPPTTDGEYQQHELEEELLERMPNNPPPSRGSRWVVVAVARVGNNS
ncbi:hypothetical protein DFP72DRAFT_1177461 [Ephemerocybe angulata]|uniref:Secreted RxLR effector peptide protein n=1 Tax=Ephemerocybe angulata TaxID=980116 RepID=A0A8H6LU46_9AGAR|nr:hypothetical protein DFP72DRAFT_1177461 [Tulosesus angulatus]